VSGCSERLLITMRGSGAASTILSRAQLPEWWEGFRSLTEGSLRSDVVLTMTSGAAHVVALRHTFVLDGRPRRYETINSCTFRQGSIASWFSRPLDLHGYAEAWGIRLAPTTMTVRTGGPGGRAIGPRHRPQLRAQCSRRGRVPKGPPGCTAGRENARPTKHRGSGVLLDLYSEDEPSLGKWQSAEPSGPFPSQRSHSELVARTVV
jgi:hypothetical protein